MRDGSVIEGRFVERTLLGPDVYAWRFAHRAGSSASVPLELGETLRVSLLDGREIIAPFEGYAELALLLRTPGGWEPLRVPFEFASGIRRADGEAVEPASLIRDFHAGLLPSAEALELALPIPPTGRLSAPPVAADIRVAVEDIASATLKTGRRSDVDDGLVLLSVVAGIVLLAAVVVMHTQPPDACGGEPVDPFGAALTQRPFDRHRGCYVGDPLAVADPWPGAMETGAATALAEGEATGAPTR
jgi:hypothetical protein